MKINNKKYSRRQFLAGLGAAVITAGGALSPVGEAVSQSLIGRVSTYSGPASVSGLRPEYDELDQYFVDPDNISGTADDTNDGSTPSLAWRTLEKARTSATSGSITLIRGCDVTVTSGASTGPLLNPVNEGASESEPLVFAAYYNETVIIRHGGSGTLVGSENNNYVWWDGCTFDGQNRDVTLGYWHETVSGGAIGCRFRHCTFRALRPDTDNNLPGGSVSAGGRGGMYLRSHEYCVVEYCRFTDIHDVNSNINLNIITSYQGRGSIFRYIQWDDCDCGSLFRAKEQPRYDAPGDEMVFWRNYAAADCTGEIEFGDGWPGAGDAAQLSVVWLTENLLSVSIGFGMDPVEYGTFKDIKKTFNTFYGTTAFSKAGGESWVRIEDEDIYGNIVFNVPNGRAYSYSASGSQQPFPYTTIYDTVDYNAFISTIGQSFGHHTQYSPTVTENQAQWQARGYDVNSIFSTTDPFVDSAAGDFRLAPGSALIGAGKSDGTSGGDSVDMGCFYLEYWLPDVGPSPM